MKRVLLVDTDEGVTLAKATIRDQFGTQLLYARDLESALEILRTHDIGLVISGIQFPHEHRHEDVAFSERPQDDETLLTHIHNFLSRRLSPV